MMAILQWFSELSMLAFVISSMLAMGISQPLQDVIAPLRNPTVVLTALLVNFVLAPLLAIGLTRVIPLEPAHATGLLLLGGAAGAPFLPKLAELSGGHLAHSVALMVLLMIGSIVFVPLAMPLIVTGLKADAWDIARPLLLLLLLPLAAGFALSRSAGAPLLLKLARRISNLSFVLLVGLLVGLNLETLAGTLSTFAIPAAAIYVLGMAAIGHLLGGKDASKRIVCALCAGNRNFAVALVVAAASFEDPAITVMLLVTSITGLMLLLMITRLMRPAAAV